MTDKTAAEDTLRHLVAPNLVAVHHDHYFNFRLDLDVDGQANSFNHDVYRAVQLPADSRAGASMSWIRRLAATEKDAQLSTGHGLSRLRVINEATTNGVGNPSSYEEIVVANHARLLLDTKDWPTRRARFLQHDVWVTPFAASERYASGDYIFMSKGDDGLPVWAARDRAIRNQDIVDVGESRHAPPDE